MLVFFGAMIGHSMLMAMPHPMFLHPTFFKMLSAIHRGEQLSEMSDLKSIDAYEAQRLEHILQYADDMTDDVFEATFDQCFTWDADEPPKELYKGSSNRKLTRQNA